MYIVTQNLDIEQPYPFHSGYSLTDIVFFDIETTGFSAKTSFVYLIGCMYYKDNTWKLTQWLTEDIVSEKALLEALLTFLNGYKRIIHYNGTGFDLPFIAQKCKTYQLFNPFSTLNSFDIYKKLMPIKKLLPMENLKLKTVESFMELKRQDVYSGEELIQIYANYLGKLQSERLRKEQPASGLLSYQNLTNANGEKPVTPSSEDLRTLLLLHNFEDVKNLLPLGSLICFAELFQEESPLWHKEADRTFISLAIQEFVIKNTCISILLSLPTAITPFSLTAPIPGIQSTEEADSKEYNNFITLTVNKDGFQIDIPILHGELKHFFPDYRDYFYLPLEDRAIHKSVAQFVDKEYRVKAKPATCYVKKTGCFLPQTDYLFSPVFQNSNKDKVIYFETDNPDFKNSSNKAKYVKATLQYFIQSKNVTVNS